MGHFFVNVVIVKVKRVEKIDYIRSLTPEFYALPDDGIARG